ncbi:retrovirus-related Pol polyprotein from transposon 297 [Trichonephila clavipes]|nr:retrovirus-related Pol polyprotein from transposon 297 [Trichonephila clavipes]
MFERQIKLLNVPADFWVSHLIGVLPSDIRRLIAREPEEMFRNYAHIHNILLQRFKLTADRFRVFYLLTPETGSFHVERFCFELRAFSKVGLFRLVGEPTSFVKHFINTSEHQPVSTAPYRLSPNRKEHLRKEIDNLLAHNIIEECESPYAASVVLVPKSNETVRLCIDYRKLNAITIPDKYPLPLLDVLLHDAKSTAFMSTLDLKSGYHQVEVNPADQDKTAFVCPFGTFRYKIMPFGLRNAPETFQRLMDQFRNGVPNVDILVYLDDIVVLYETFEQHIEDLRVVFGRLKKFKLCANREKCKFVCSRVKYLGLWITPKGIEVDQDKTAAIQNIPSPRNLKQLHSLLQTCSWYRKFIPNFLDIARPLSNLSKKSTAWKWSEIEQQAFQTLKQCLITPPILRQVDPKKHFIIQTDASSYALGAVLLQGESPTDEQTVEYASTLLSSAEKNTRQQSEKPWL